MIKSVAIEVIIVKLPTSETIVVKSIVVKWMMPEEKMIASKFTMVKSNMSASTIDNEDSMSASAIVKTVMEEAMLTERISPYSNSAIPFL